MRKFELNNEMRAKTARMKDMQLAHKLYDIAARTDDEQEAHYLVESAQRMARTLTMMTRERVN